MKTQLELGFDRTQTRRLTQQRRSTIAARWWFDQMHAVVDSAFDWSLRAPGRPEQIYFGLVTRRAVKVQR